MKIFEHLLRDNQFLVSETVQPRYCVQLLAARYEWYGWEHHFFLIFIRAHTDYISRLIDPFVELLEFLVGLWVKRALMPLHSAHPCATDVVCLVLLCPARRLFPANEPLVMTFSSAGIIFPWQCRSPRCCPFFLDAVIWSLFLALFPCFCHLFPVAVISFRPLSSFPIAVISSLSLSILPRFCHFFPVSFICSPLLSFIPGCCHSFLVAVIPSWSLSSISQWIIMCFYLALLSPIIASFSMPPYSRDKLLMFPFISSASVEKPSRLPL